MACRLEAEAEAEASFDDGGCWKSWKRLVGMNSHRAKFGTIQDTIVLWLGEKLNTFILLYTSKY